MNTTGKLEVILSQRNANDNWCTLLAYFVMQHWLPIITFVRILTAVCKTKKEK